MASIDHYFASKQDLWGDFSSSGKDSLTVSEVWHLKGLNNEHTALHRTLKNEELPTWLENTECSQPTDIALKNKSCVLRVAWIPHDRKQCLNDVGAVVLEQLIGSFHHELAQTRFRATFAGAASLTDPSNGRRTHYLCNHPHLAVSWSQCPRSGLTSVICIAQPRKLVILQDILTCPFVQDVAHLEFTPALMCAILCCREIDILINVVKQKVRQTEVRTGHHSFTTRSEPPATGDLLALSADMSGCMSNLAVNTRRLGVLREWNKFAMDGAARKGKEQNSEEEGAALQTFIANITAIEQHSMMQNLDLEFFLRRAQIQREALMHLIAEHDVLANQKLAKDTHCLAVIAQQDSAGIKALTMIATLFIPPTFVSSLFSTPLFAWNSSATENDTGGTEIWKKTLLLYIMIAGSLMLVMCSIWGLLILWRRLKQKKEAKKSQMMTYCTFFRGSEVISLISERMLGRSASGDSEVSSGRF